jgi:hypothetical protein
LRQGSCTKRQDTLHCYISKLTRTKTQPLYIWEQLAYFELKLKFKCYILFLILEDDVDDGMTKALNVRTTEYVHILHPFPRPLTFAAPIVLGCWIEIMGIIFTVYSRLTSVLQMQ